MSKSKLVLKTLISCDKLISVNKRLWGSRSRGMRHSPEYELEQKQLIESLESNNIKRDCLGNDHLYSLTYVLYLKENISRRDTDNLIKSVTDVISNYLGFNDNKIVSYQFSKRQIVDFGEEPAKEYVLVEVKQVEGWWDSLKLKFAEFKNFMEDYLK